MTYLPAALYMALAGLNVYNLVTAPDRFWTVLSGLMALLMVWCAHGELRRLDDPRKERDD